LGILLTPLLIFSVIPQRLALTLLYDPIESSSIKFFRRGIMKNLIITGLMATLLLAPLAGFARSGVVVVHSAPRGFVGPGFGWGWGWGPYWASPYWSPYYGYYDYAPNTGALKFDTHNKNAEVYVNGAYAGTVGKLKTMHLRTGSYDIEVRGQGRSQFDQKVYIAAGKTLHLNPDLRGQGEDQPQQR
jgi:hypothetical protein